MDLVTKGGFLEWEKVLVWHLDPHERIFLELIYIYIATHSEVSMKFECCREL